MERHCHAPSYSVAERHSSYQAWQATQADSMRSASIHFQTLGHHLQSSLDASCCYFDRLIGMHLGRPFRSLLSFWAADTDFEVSCRAINISSGTNCC